MQYEYREALIETADKDRLQALNRLGQEGWQVVNVGPVEYAKKGGKIVYAGIYLFMREKPSDFVPFDETMAREKW